eukprot:s687_g13.t1
MSCESNSSDLVTFNVGGKIYQVLREPTLSLHPNSLLTQMAEDQKDDKPIFVEGDQDLFKYVIDFHRDRKVILPITVSTDAVMRELKRFGLEATESQIVQDGVPFPSLMRRVAKWQEANTSRKRKATLDFLGSLIAEVASEKMGQAKGKAFSIRRNDLPCNEKELDRLFGRVAASQVQESEALKDFERSFGYSFVSFGTGSTALSPWSSTEFRPV